MQPDHIATSVLVAFIFHINTVQETRRPIQLPRGDHRHLLWILWLRKRVHFFPFHSRVHSLIMYVIETGHTEKGSEFNGSQVWESHFPSFEGL